MPLTFKLCHAKIRSEAIPWKAQGLWQNSTATKCSIQFLQQSSESHTRGFAQEVTKGLLIAQAVPRLRKRLCNQQSFVFSATSCSGTPCTVPTSPQPVQKKLPASALPLPFDLDLDGGGLRASAFLRLFCLSQFESLNAT